MSSFPKFNKSKNWKFESVSNCTYIKGVDEVLQWFLSDEIEDSVISDRKLFHENSFEWGEYWPLEKVVDSRVELGFLLDNPKILERSMAIIEPWRHVGCNALGEKVRASKNVAYALQKIANVESVLFPIWESGIWDERKMVSVMNDCLALVIEGGEPSVYNAASFSSACSKEETLSLVEALLLSRNPGSAPAIFICLGHQLAAEAHVRIIKRAVNEILNTAELSEEQGSYCLRSLKRVAERIQSVGESLLIRKKGKIIASGWRDAQFSVGVNEAKEIGEVYLESYSSSSVAKSDLPLELIESQRKASREIDGVIDTLLACGKHIEISMFHSDEVNEQSILFSNWAYGLIYDVVLSNHKCLAEGPLGWLLNLPHGIEILCSTSANGKVLTEVAATCINYKDFKNGTVRRSITAQFHPELFGDLRAMGQRGEMSLEELREDDGIRLLMTLIHEGLREELIFDENESNN